MVEPGWPETRLAGCAANTHAGITSARDDAQLLDFLRATLRKRIDLLTSLYLSCVDIDTSRLTMTVGA